MSDQQDNKRRRDAGDETDPVIQPRRSKRLATRLSQETGLATHRAEKTGIEAMPIEDAGDESDAAMPQSRSKRLAARLSQETGLATRRAEKTGIEAMPIEITDRIFGEVAFEGDDERSVARNLTSIARIGKGFQQRLIRSPAGKYGHSLNEAGNAAKRNYAMLPRGKFREWGPVPVDDYVGMIAPGIHLLPSHEQLKVVGKVLAISSDWRRADALNKIASYADGLDDDNSRALLLDAAIDLIEQPSGHHSFHACKAVAKMYAHRTDGQEVRIADVRNSDPLAAATIDAELGAIDRRENTSTVENTPIPSPEVGGNHEPISVTKRVKNAAKDLKIKLDEAQTARVGLIKTMRPRDGRA